MEPAVEIFSHSFYVLAMFRILLAYLSSLRWKNGLTRSDGYLIMQGRANNAELSRVKPGMAHLRLGVK